MDIKLVNIGFGNIVAANRIISIISPESAPIKRIIQEARDKGMLVDATYGRRTRAVVVVDSGHIILSAVQPETVANRLVAQTADSEEELINKKMQIKNYLEAMEMRAFPLRFEQEKVLKSILPIYSKQDIEDRIGTPIPAPTIAAMYPFIFDSIKDPGLSTLLGVDFSGGVILFNQFLYQIKKEHNRNNANLIILGTSGSGKSTAAKLMIRSHIRNNNQIVIICLLYTSDAADEL